MWILNFLPTWIAYAIALLGATGLVVSIFAGFLSHFIPQLLVIKLPLQLISVVVLVFGVYLSGGVANQEMWEARVKEIEKKVEIAEQKAKEANSKIEYKFIDKIKTVKEVQVVIQEKIKEVEKIIDAKCEVPPEVLDILNTAAKNTLPSTSKFQDEREAKALKNTKDKLQ
jgi:hypothetical protein